MSRFTYICTKGHVDSAQRMGEFDCNHLLRVVHPSGVGYGGRVPCGEPVVAVPFDAGLEAAYLVGGADAVLLLLRERLTDAHASVAARSP